jgi:tyrosine-protein phosphatase SIW14
MLGMRLAAGVILLTTVGVGTPQNTPPVRSAPGVPNFHQVNESLFRGGQPSEEGLRSLAKLGVKTIVDLRMSRRIRDWESKAVAALGMRYVHLPLYGKETPSRKDIEKAFSVLEDAERWPVFVHCREGKDRTGMIVGCYRIAHDGWTNMRALAEAKTYASRELTHAMEDYIRQFNPADVGVTTSK